MILLNKPPAILLSKHGPMIGPIKPGIVIVLPEDAILINMDDFGELNKEAENLMIKEILGDVGLKPIINNSKPLPEAELK